MPSLATPSQPLNTAISGGTYAPGGNNTTGSGSVTEWAEYRQWATITYSRNPFNTIPSIETIDRDLLQVSSTQARTIGSTRLHFDITVHNSCTIWTGDFSTSANNQRQKFQLNANRTCKAGYSHYGDVSGANNLYVFGAQGQIVTSQPYIKRRPKVISDVAYNFTQRGTTDALEVSSGYNYGMGSVNNPFDYYLWASQDVGEGTSTKWPLTKAQGGADHFHLAGGGYNTTSEEAYGDNAAGLTRLITFLEQNLVKLAFPSFHDRYNVMNPVNSDGNYFIVEADKIPVNPYYSTAHHDYV